MVFKVIFSPRAIERLERVVRYIARDNPGQPSTSGCGLSNRRSCWGISPHLGAPYRKRPGVRRLLCKPYLIYYRVKEREQVVEVLDYWHSAREEPESL